MENKNRKWSFKGTLVFILILETTLTLGSCIDKKASSENTTSTLRQKEVATIKDYDYYINKGYQVSKEYGFAFKAPCILEDVSNNAPGDFALNLGGIDNSNNPKKLAAYQLILIKVPVGYKDFSPAEFEKVVDAKLKSTLSSFQNLKKVNVSYENYSGYTGETEHNGYKQKGLIFHKEKYIYCLTVMSNDNLESRFNSFTNSLKFINNTLSSYNVNVINKYPSSKRQVFPSINISIEAPCELKSSKMEGFDYHYIGAVNPNDKEKAVVYKIIANQLPQSFSSMTESDKKIIKKNLNDYSRGKGTCQKIILKENQYFGNIISCMEQGYFVKEALILTNEFVYEFILFSKLDIEKDFNTFLKNLKYTK